jgi:hypothetical protein
LEAFTVDRSEKFWIGFIAGASFLLGANSALICIWVASN